MKQFILIMVIFLGACSAPKTTYILPQKKIFIGKSYKTIAVRKVSLPDYLDSETIMIQEKNKITSLNAKFIAPPSELFTQKAITFFKQALNDPNIFLYPWELDKKKGILVDIKIDNALYKDGSVLLSGSYYLKNLQNNIVISEKNFNLSEKTANNASHIVNSLNRLYNKVLEEISYKIAK